MNGRLIAIGDIHGCHAEFAELLAQLAPVVLFPIFYKFEPLENEELKRRLIVLSERAGTRVRGVYKWHLSEKSKKANAALTGILSEVDSRYEARIIWLLPVLAGLMIYNWFDSRKEAGRQLS